MSIEVAFMVWLIGIALVCQVVEWRQKRRVNSLRDELGIVSKFHDKPIPFKNNFDNVVDKNN